MSYHDEPAYADNEIVPSVDFDYDATGVFEPEPAEPERDIDSMAALLSVVFQLGQWSGRDPVKEFAAQTVMRQTTQCPKRFAIEHKVSESFVFRRIREARAVISSPAKPD